MDMMGGEVGARHVTIQMAGAICSQPAQVLQAEAAVAVIQNFLNDLCHRKSRLMRIFEGMDLTGDRQQPAAGAYLLARTLGLLTDWSWQEVALRAPDVAPLLLEPQDLAQLVEDLYDHWRRYERYLLFEGKASETRDRAIEGHRPFTVNNETLSSLVRDAYRHIQRNLRGYWPRVYRQVPAGANMSLLVERIDWLNPGGIYEQLSAIRMVRLALLVPPVTLYPRRNARQGRFMEVYEHPLTGIELDPQQWLCLPIRVGELCFHFYFDQEYMALAMSLVNLFELAEHDEARYKPDGMVFFGLPLEQMGGLMTTYYVDESENMVVGAVAKSEETDYFGYCKKITLTLHNVIMMRRGRLPVHGAMCHIGLKEGPKFSVVIVGDSGAGKSETLEAFRVLAEEWISDLTIIFDDMGSLQLTPDGRLLGYGTEIGAFVRLDDLAPGYAFGHFDRSIFMNPHRHNARLVMPLTEYRDVVAGYPVDLLLYANNYEQVTDEVPAVEFFQTVDEALEVFRAGYRAAKGTTDEKGLVRTYFANPFGAEQQRDLHEPLARQYFNGAMHAGVKVGQVRTRLGVAGYEQEGPRQAAEALFRLLHEGENSR
jgi:hypothetical protein